MLNQFIFILLILSLSVVGRAEALPVLNQTERARQIADMNINRDDGKAIYRQVILATCKYHFKNGKQSCQSRPVKKKIESLCIDVGENLEDTTSLGIINAPPSEKNMAFLQKDYDQEGKESDQWMYFPALKKFKRIVSQSDNSPKTGSLFGSEIAYEDNEKRHLSNYRYSYEGQEAIDGKTCDKVIAFPTPGHQPKISYSKEVYWIDRESKIALKVEFYDKQERLNKTFFHKEITKMKGVWIHKILIVVNHLSGHMTLEKTTRMAINIPIESQLLEQRALKDTSFRESKMITIRRQAKP